jgi:hypothetical protein
VFERYKQFVGAIKPPNRFWPVTADEIGAAEARLGHEFPSELRKFFQEIGYGFYGEGIKDSKRTHVNRVMDPTSIADILLDKSEPYRPHEGFLNGVMPFFDLGESTFLVLKPKTTLPNRVFWPDGVKVVSESLIEFFEELYVHADFYHKST